MINTTINPIPNFGTQDLAKKAGGSDDFGSMLQNVMGEFMGQQKQSENISGQAVMGKANLVDVMTSVTNAETSLNLLTSIRDKFVQAYQEISRMPV